MGQNPVTLPEAAQLLAIGELKRHIFLCTDTKCSPGREGEAAWKQLKKRLKELDKSVQASIFRSKVGCLRVCMEGPIAVVYPEGTWYSRMIGSRLDRVIEEHLVQGRPVAEFCFAVNPLSTGE